MAVIANLSSPAVTDAPDPDGITAVMQGRLPVPARAWGFVVTPDPLEVPPSGISIAAPGALFPESPYLEPTIGQIWPR